MTLANTSAQFDRSLAVVPPRLADAVDSSTLHGHPCIVRIYGRPDTAHAWADPRLSCADQFIREAIEDARGPLVPDRENGQFILTCPTLPYHVAVPCEGVDLMDEGTIELDQFAYDFRRVGFVCANGVDHAIYAIDGVR